MAERSPRRDGEEEQEEEEEGEEGQNEAPQGDRERLKAEIRRKYTSGKDAISFSGITNIKRHYPQASIELIREALSGIETYTLFRQPKFPKHYNPIYVRRARELVQADLIDLQSLANSNDGVKYLLVIIDSFTRFAWIRPLKDKSSKTVLAAFKDINENGGLNLGEGHAEGLEEAFLADQGTEFVNRQFKQYLQSKNVEVRTANNKAPHVERFNQTIQSLLFRYMEEKETERYVDQLANLLKLYNNRYHNTIQMAPKEAEDGENLDILTQNVNQYYEKAVGSNEALNKKETFKIGDLVRISKHRGPFYKGYYQSFLPKIYEIAEVLRNLPIVMYKIKDNETGEMESGTWYAKELQLVDQEYLNTETVFKIEKILRKRTRNGVREGLVKWKYWPDKYNSWEPLANIRNINQRESEEEEEEENE